MGQPMSSSYENRWLSAGDESSSTTAAAKKGSPLSSTRRKSVTNTEENTSSAKNTSNASTPKEKKQKENTRPPHNPHEAPKKAQKDMTKAERRALQEKQRLEKQNRVAAGLPKSAKQAAELEAKTGVSATTTPSASGADAGDATKLQQQKKKAANKNQQNQVPWLLHLDAPKTSDALQKDLHPAVLQLGLYFSEHKIVGSNARCVAMLEIFSKVKLSSFQRSANGNQVLLTIISTNRSFQIINHLLMLHFQDTFKSI